MQWIVSPEPPPPKVYVPVVEDLMLTEGYTSAIDKVQWLKTNLNVSKEQIEQFAGCTAYKWTNKQSSMVYGKKESLDCI